MATPFDECLEEAVIEKVITERQRDDFKKALKAATEEMARLGQRTPDSNELGALAIKRMMEKVGERKIDLAAKVTGFNGNVAAVLDTKVTKLPAAIEKIFGATSPVYRGLEALLGERLRGWGTPYSLVEAQKAATNVMDAALDKFLEASRGTALGLKRNWAPAIDAAREVLGKDTGNATAKAHAKAWREAMDWAVDMLRELHVPIRAIDNYLPQIWNVGKLTRMGEDNFVEAMMDRYRRGAAKFRDFNVADKAVYFKPGEAADDARVLEILRGKGDKPGMYKNITTNGDAGLVIGQPKGESIAERYNRRRVVEWQGDEAYLDFVDTFGNGRDRLGEDMVRHKDQMAHDIGTAKVLGNTPNERVAMLIDWGKKTGKLSDGQVNALEKTWYHASGQANAPVNVAIANLAQTTRLWLSGAQLSQAMLSAVVDPAWAKSVATLNGLNGTRMMAEFLKGPVAARDARRLGIAVSDNIQSIRDHAGEQFTANGAATFAGQAAEFVMRGTGLDAWTTMGRSAIGKEFLATFADVSGKTWQNLPPLNRHFLERYGIDGAEWEILRTKAMTGEKLYMDPATLARTSTGADRSAAMKLIGAIGAEIGQGIHEGGVATRAMMLGRTKPGEYVGELLRALNQYQGFGASVMLKTGWRTIDTLFDQNGTMPRGRYIAGLVINATILGALSLQLRNIANGRDVENMETAAFWTKAYLQGGGGGIAGDYIKTLWQTKSTADFARALPPTAGLMYDTYALTTGNAAQWWDSEPTNTGREAVRYGKKYLLPRLWHTNLAFDRIVWDTAQRMVDPAASQAFHRLDQRLREQTGQSYFSKPGSDIGDMRMPEYANPRAR